MMTAALLVELAHLFRTEADGIAEPYAWPPRVLTPEELREVDRLTVTGNALFYRSRVAAYDEGRCGYCLAVSDAGLCAECSA